nr:MAG TPA: acetyl-coA carboxylase zinc finger domain protein [Caudoviricetes sp.]
MLISEKIIEKEFSGKNMKEAYLNCCKWVSTNIIAVNNSDNITYSIQKKRTQNTYIVVLKVYVSADENEVHEKNCAICKEVTHNLFLSENKYMCEGCKIKPYRKRLEDRLKLLKEGMKGKIL